MGGIKQWKQNNITIQPNQVYEYNAQSEMTNIFQIINRVASGGGVVLVDIDPGVSATSYMLRVDQGSNQNLVLPYQAKRIFLKSDADVPVILTIVEITSDDILFTFGAAQLVNISGNVQVQEPVTVDGTVSVSGEMEVKNDSGNPIPVTGNVGITGTPTVNIGTAPELSVHDDPYQYIKVTAGGDTQVKAAAGTVIGIKSDGTTVAILKDGTGVNSEVWKTTGESHFSKPIQFNNNITVNLSQAGECYLIYQ